MCARDILHKQYGEEHVLEVSTCSVEIKIRLLAKLRLSDRLRVGMEKGGKGPVDGKGSSNS